MQKKKKIKKNQLGRQAQKQEKQPPWFPWWFTAWQYSTTHAEIEHYEKQCKLEVSWLLGQQPGLCVCAACPIPSLSGSHAVLIGLYHLLEHNSEVALKWW